MKTTNTRKLLVSSLLAQMALLGSALSPTAFAASYYWDTNGTTTGAGATPTGNWDGTNLFWNTASSGTPTPTLALVGSANDAFFSAGTDATGAYTVTASGTTSAPLFANSLTFEDGTPTLTGGVIQLTTTTSSSGLVGSIVAATTLAGTATVSSGIRVDTAANNTLVKLTANNGAGATDLLISGAITTTNSANTYQLRIAGTGNGRLATNLGSAGSNFAGIQALTGGTWTGNWTIAGTQTWNSTSALTLGSGTQVGVGSRLIMGDSAGDNQSWSTTSLNNTNANLLVNSNATLSGATSVALGVIEVAGSINSSSSLAVGSATTAGTFRISGSASFAGGFTSPAFAGSKIVGASSAPGNLTLSSGNITSSVTIGGAGANENNLNLIKANSGTLAIAGSHTYTGSTAVNGGNLTLSSGATLGTSGIAVNNTGTLYIASTALTSGVTVNNGGTANFSVNSSSVPVLVNAGGTLTGEGGAGALSFGNGASTFNFDATTPGSFTAASYTPNTSALVLLTPVGVTTIGTAYDVMTATAGFAGGVVPNEFAASARGSLSLVTNTIKFTPTAAASLVWTGSVNGNWDVVNSQNWTNNSTADRFYASDSVAFGNAGGNTTISVPGAISAGNITFTNSTKDYAFSGAGSITTSGVLDKSGAGNVTIANSVATTGISVTGGSLALNGAINIGAGDITVGSGSLALGAANTATGNITLNSGGVLNANTGTSATVGSLGSFAGGRTITLNGGTLNYGGTGTISTENMNLSVTGDSVLGVTTATATLRTGGVFSGAGNLSVTGPGILALGKNAADANWGSGYSGNIVISNAAVLSLRNEQSLGNTSGNTTVQSGGTLMMDPFGQTGVSFGESIAFHGNSTLSNRYNGQTSLSNSLTGIITTSGTLGVNTLSSSATSATLNFNGPIGGAGGVTFGSALSFTGLNGASVTTLPGTYVLNAANSYAGPTVVNSGSVTVSSTGSLASGNALSVGSGATVNFQNVGQTLGAVSNSNTLNFSANTGTVTLTSLGGTGSTSFSSNASIGTISGGTNTITGTAAITTLSGGNTTVGGVASIGTMSAGRANLNGATSTISTLNGGTVALGSSTVLTVNGGSFGGTLTGGNLLTGGNFTFAAGSSFSGNTTVSTGNKLVVNGTLSGSSLSIASGATLGGNGTISASASFASGAMLAPGNSPGILSFGSSTDLTGVTTEMELAGTGGTAGTDFDKINVTGDLKYGGTLNIVSYNGFNFDVAGTYNLFDSTSISGTFVNVNVGSVSLSGSLGTWTGSNLAGTYGYSFVESTGEFAVTAIPEPSAYAALAGFGVIGVVLYRRRRVTVSK